MRRFQGLAAPALLVALLLATQSCERAGLAHAQTSAAERDVSRAGVEGASLEYALALSGAFRAAAEAALPAVVYVSAIQPGAAAGGVRQAEAAGSGFVFDERGHILTNAHVVSGAGLVSVRFIDGREYEAEVIGSDPDTDVAVLRLVSRSATGFGVAALADSDLLDVGDWVLALGSPLNLDFTVTAGIVSAKARSIGILGRQTALESFIQTDAAINPGNSGGPLIDLRGRVVGINSAIQSESGRFIGYGFAVPINIAMRVASDLIEHGVVHRPRLGIEVRDVNAVDAEAYGLTSVTGAHVSAVQPGTPAEAAGLRAGDVIRRLDDEPVRTGNELTTRLAQRRPGDRIRLGVVRYGEELTLTTRLGAFQVAQRPAARPAPEASRGSGLLGFRVAAVGASLAARLDVDPGSPAVAALVAGGPAARAGLREGQVIVALNRVEIGSAAELERAARGLRAGDVVSLRVIDPEVGETVVNYRTRG